ncbi:unnamed protein product [Durusdinium trenchii]|uniref:EF-hand domain-containing protein n=1 Tax=Durusdinium trenchii TaxID=1381693 RepID=A0ABP0R4T7_9DINO
MCTRREGRGRTGPWGLEFLRSGSPGARLFAAGRFAHLVRVAASRARQRSFARASECSELREVFELADADDNGKISAQELLSALRVLGITTDLSRVRSIVADLDRDGDGEIDFQEFIQVSCSPQSDLLLRAVNRGRFVSRWSALLFEHDDPSTWSVRKWARAARRLEHLTDSDLSRLLDDRLATPSAAVFGGSFVPEDHYRTGVMVRLSWSSCFRM